MDNELLIECVRQYEFIYNSRHPKYMDNGRKEMAWKDIARQLQSTPGCCKQRWQVLRDACRRAINKRKSGQAKTFKKWTYEDEMSFVIPYFGERKTHDPMEVTCDDAGSAEIDNESYCIVPDNSNTDVGVYKTNAVDVNTNYQGITEDDEKHHINTIQNRQYVQSKKISNTKNSLIKKTKYRSVQSPSAALLTKLLEKQNKMESQREHDELDRFFLNLSETVKRFSPYQQALAKHKIFSIISEMELQQLATSFPNDVTPPSQTTSPRESVVFSVIPKLEYE